MRNSKGRSLLLTIPTLFVFAFSGSDAVAKNVTAPYDAGVCLGFSYSDCVTHLGGYVRAQYNKLFDEKNGRPVLRAEDIIRIIPDPEKTVNYKKQTAGSNDSIDYQCAYKIDLYTPNMDAKKTRAAVFVSVPLLIQLQDHLKRLQRAEDRCHDLISSFNYDAGLSATQADLASNEGVVALLSANIQSEIYSKEGVGMLPHISVAQINAWGLVATAGVAMETDAKALYDAHKLSVVERNTIRVAAQDNLMFQIYGSKFADAQAEIEYYQTLLEEDLYLLDLGVFEGTLKNPTVGNGDWVTKGNIIGTTN